MVEASSLGFWAPSRRGDPQGRRGAASHASAVERGPGLQRSRAQGWPHSRDSAVPTTTASLI